MSLWRLRAASTIALAAVDSDHRTAGRDAPRQRRRVVPETAPDLQDDAARPGGEQVIAFALALREERQRVDQRQATGEHLEIRSAIHSLESRGEIIGHRCPLTCPEQKLHDATIRPRVPDR
jgi:hypothetical protein